MIITKTATVSLITAPYRLVATRSRLMTTSPTSVSTCSFINVLQSTSAASNSLSRSISFSTEKPYLRATHGGGMVSLRWMDPSSSWPASEHRSSVLLRSAFHTSSVTHFPVRRRKRSGGSGLGKNNTGGSTMNGVGANGSTQPPQQRQQEDVSSDDQAVNDVDDDKAPVAPTPLRHLPVRDIQLFRHAASDLLDKLERALLPMKSKNDIFIMSREDGDIGETFKLELGPTIGHYLIEISEDECVMQYSSPISGHILYFLSSSTNEWLAVDDGHSFEGIFVRDLIRHCQGLPAL